MTDETQATERRPGKQMYDSIIEHFCYCGVLIGSYHLLSAATHPGRIAYDEAVREHRAMHKRQNKAAASVPQKDEQ
jgi:hypothetical protein